MEGETLQKIYETAAQLTFYGSLALLTLVPISYYKEKQRIKELKNLCNEPSKNWALFCKV